jgi:hypothetical protein
MMRDWIKRFVVDPIFYRALFASIVVIYLLSVLYSRLLFHHNTQPEGRYPLCSQSAADGKAPTRGFYTRHVARVSCKKCLHRLARQAQLSD